MFTASCQNCGLVFRSRAFGFADNSNIQNLTLVGNRETCPRCRHWADIQSGTFNVVNGVVKNVLSENASRTTLVAFHEVISGYQSGDVSRANADSEIEKLGAGFSEIWSWIGENEKQIVVVLAIITILLSSYFSYASLIEVRKMNAHQMTSDIENRIKSLDKDNNLESHGGGKSSERYIEGGEGDIV